MSVSVLDKYVTAEPAEEDDSPEANATDESEVRPFGWLRGTRDRALMLVLRKRDGNILAFAYSRLEFAEYDPTEGITLHFGNRLVRITGRNLNGECGEAEKLFEGITRNRVPYVRESPRDAVECEEAVTVIIVSIDTQ